MSEEVIGRPVLATCGIRAPVEPFGNSSSRYLLLADSVEEEYNRKHSPAQLHKGVTYTVHGILTFFKQLIGLCFQSLHHRFVVWTTPNTTSLLLGTLTDLARSKSELVAENARLASTSDHPTTTGETACLYQDGPHTPRISGQDGINMEASAVHRSAGDEARVGIARGTSSSGSTSPEQLLSSQGSLMRRWP